MIFKGISNDCEPEIPKNFPPAAGFYTETYHFALIALRSPKNALSTLRFQGTPPPGEGGGVFNTWTPLCARFLVH